MGLNDSEGAYFGNSRSLSRYEKRFGEKFMHPIDSYLPLLPSHVQTHFLLFQIILLTSLILTLILLAKRFDREVKTYFRDLYKKLQMCGRRTETLDDHVAELLVEQSSALSALARAKQSVFGVLGGGGGPGRRGSFKFMQSHNASITGEDAENSGDGGIDRFGSVGGIRVDDHFETYPSKSKYKNFSRQRSVLKLHLPFAHDLANFMAMVDGEM